MSPRPAVPAARAALVDAAAQLLAEDGPAALTARRLAAAAGTSTMAVYTRFGGMDDVRLAVRETGFAALTAELDALEPTADPVADLAATGSTYLAAGIARPHLYRAMVVDRPVQDDTAGAATFERFVADVRRCLDAGRFRGVDPVIAAAQLWSMRHGMVTMALAEIVPPAQVVHVMADMTVRLAVGYGDDPGRAEESVNRPGTRRPGP